MKNAVINTFLSIFSIIVAILLIEGAAIIYVDKIAMREKLFEPDATTGWRVKPNIKIQRKNSDGNLWIVKTDNNGFRGNFYWDSNKKRVLILGDSFAFGEGVDVDDRFDSKIISLGYSVLNTGVMGYGTDQQYLKAENYLNSLNAGDIAIVLTYSNDFYDITRKKHSGRAKPWYDFNNGRLRLHKPRITLREILRDKSYIYAMLSTFLEKHHEIPDPELIQATNIYQMIVNEMSQQLTSRGVHFIVAYHGILAVKDTEQRNMIVRTLNTICESATVDCINIDRHFNANNHANYYLADGHWNNKGHDAVSVLLAEKLSDISRNRTRTEHNRLYSEAYIIEPIYAGDRNR